MIESALSTPLGYAVPGNRWDLVTATSNRLPKVSVVVPFYDQQSQLDMLLASLRQQTLPVLEVVIADDGSPTPPVVDSPLHTVVVRQDDRGFRAAAARNLGARAASGDVLCFLDADTVPEPGYVEALVRLPALVPDALTVGRRRHADLSALGRLPGSQDEILDEPGWLLDAYRGSRNLLDADFRSYRHVISAVMCCTAAFFAEIGGFDESFTRYGGEDWELANRAFLAGAVLAHVPEAVAWHDGPEWADRSETARRENKNAEAMSLSPLISDPAARAHGIRFDVPDVTAVVRTDGHTAASLLVTVGSVLGHGDVIVWVDGPGAADLVASWKPADPRIRIGTPAPDEVSRSRFGLEVTGPVVFDAGALRRLGDSTPANGPGLARCTLCGGSAVEWWSWRAVRRARRWARALGRSEEEVLTELFGVVEIDSDDVGASVGPDHPDLSW
ncbi:MAG: glycosyltransferase [Rhodococcus sp. (in: high G+C Gram-positive bacteria)]